MIPLEESDIAKLESYKKPAAYDKVVLILLTLFSPLIPFIVGFFNSVNENPSPIFTSHYIYWIFPLCLLAFQIGFFRFRNRHIRYDLRMGTKQTITEKIVKISSTKRSAYAYKGPMPHQLIGGSYMEHTIRIGPYKGVIVSNVEDFAIGKAVTAEIAPKSMLILNISK